MTERTKVTFAVALAVALLALLVVICVGVTEEWPGFVRDAPRTCTSAQHANNMHTDARRIH